MSSNEYYEKMYNDFTFFAEKALKIRSRAGRPIMFRLNKAQKHIIKIIEKQKIEQKQARLIIVKGRQMGISTLVSALNFHNGLTKFGQRSVVMAHRKDAAKNILKMLQYFYEHLPQQLKNQHILSSEHELRLSSQGSLWHTLTAGSNDVGRSETLQFLHGSEVAFWQNTAKHISALLATTHDGNNSHVILESTACGNVGAFYDLAMASLKGNSKFELVFLPWFWEKSYRSQTKIKPSKAWEDYQKTYDISDEQLAWAIEKNMTYAASNGQDAEQGPTQRFMQEYPANIQEAFQASLTDGLISAINVQKAIDNNLLDDLDAPLIFGVDIAHGGGDLSHIIARKGRKLGHILNEGRDLDDAMAIADWIAGHIEKLKPSKVFLDAGTIGAAVHDRLKQLGFGNYVTAVYFASQSSDPKRWLNKRAEMWDKMRDWFADPAGADMTRDTQLMREVCSVNYQYTSLEQIKIEPKDEIRKRLGHSPDKADAAALTFAYPVTSLQMQDRYYLESPQGYDPLQDW